MVKQNSLQTLEDHLRYYACMLEKGPDAVIATDMHFHILLWNQAAAKIYGWRAEEAIGQHLPDLVETEFPTSSSEEMLRCLVEKGTWQGELIQKSKTGDRLHLSSSGTLVRDEQHQPIGIIVINRDITQYKRTQAALNRYVDRLKVLHEIDQAILVAESPQDICQSALRQIRRLIPSAEVVIVRINPIAQQGTIYAAEPPSLIGTQFSLIGAETLVDLVYQGNALFVEDLASLPCRTPVEEMAYARGIRSYISIPLMARDNFLGTLNLTTEQPHRLTAEHLEITEEIAHSLAVALQQARLHEQVQHRLKALHAVYETSRQLQQLHDTESLSQEIVRILEENLKYVYSAVLLIDPASQRLVPFAISHRAQTDQFISDNISYVVREGVKIGTGITGWVAQTGQSLNVGDVDQDPRYLAIRKGIRSELCVPLRIGDEVIGVVNIESMTPYAYSDLDQQVLETVASVIAVAIQNARLFDQVRAEQQRLQALSQRLVLAQESERRHLSRELHDQVGQMLTALKLNLQTLHRQSAGGPLSAQLAETIQIAAQTLEKVRNLSLELRPAILDDLGLVAALRSQVDRITQQTNLNIQLEVKLSCLSLPPEIETACFRIVQEALTNVTRHAQARHVRIALHQHADELHLMIQDDGVGFEVEPALVRTSFGRSLGLLNMQERVDALGGHLAIISASGQGTRIQVCIPCSAFNGQPTLPARGSHHL